MSVNRKFFSPSDLFLFSVGFTLVNNTGCWDFLFCFPWHPETQNRGNNHGPPPTFITYCHYHSQPRWFVFFLLLLLVLLLIDYLLLLPKQGYTHTCRTCTDFAEWVARPENPTVPAINKIKLNIHICTHIYRMFIKYFFNVHLHF